MSAVRKLSVTKVLIGVIALYVACVFLTLRPGDRSLYPAVSGSIPVYILNNGFHTDIVVPADQVMAAGLPTTPMLDGMALLLKLDLSLRAHVR